MKRVFYILIVSLICISTYAGIFDKDFDTRNALCSYKPIYFLTGFTPEEQVKIQISLMYDVFFPIKTGFYFGYTQMMFWDLYAASGPFREINYNPEIFWRFESGNNPFGDISILLLDYFQAGYEHLSNGKDGADSRGYDDLNAQVQLSIGDVVNFGINFKYFIMVNKKENPDIQDYIGSMTTTLFLKLIDPNTHLDLEEIYFRFGFGGGPFGFDFVNGWQELGLKSRTLFSRFRPFIQLYRGYAESILEYDVTKQDLDQFLGIAFKIGLVLE